MVMQEFRQLINLQYQAHTQKTNDNLWIEIQHKDLVEIEDMTAALFKESYSALRLFMHHGWKDWKNDWEWIPPPGRALHIRLVIP